MQKRMLHTLEIIWLSLALLSLLAGIYYWYTGEGEILMFFVMSFLAFMMYFYRRHLRKSKNP